MWGARGRRRRHREQATPAATAAAKPDISALGDVTLTVWDQEVRGGQKAQIEELNKQFQAKYPNVKIERVAKSFEDTLKTVKLGASDPNAPDIVPANQGRGIMGELVKAKLLRPLDDYAKVYGWADRYSPTLLDLNRFSPDGKEFGSGDLYGLSQMGEIVGVYYNKEKVPTPPATLAEFEASLQEAKDAGETPIQFGNLEKWPGIHNFESVLGQFADKQAVRDFVFAKEGAIVRHAGVPGSRREDPGVGRQGLLQQELQRHRLRPGVAGVREGRQPLPDRRHVGDGRPRQGDGRQRRLHADAGQRSRTRRSSLGGESLPYAITSAAKNPDVAAAYIDFLTDANAAKVLVDTDNLPAMKGAPAPASGVSVEVARPGRSSTRPTA